MEKWTQPCTRNPKPETRNPKPQKARQLTRLVNLSQVMEKWTLYKELQETFKETHKSTDRLRGTSMQPTELKREVDPRPQGYLAHEKSPHPLGLPEGPMHSPTVES